MTLTIVVVALGVAGSLTYAQNQPAPDKNEENVKRFMRAKLKHGQRVLEGLVSADFENIHKGANEMYLLCEAARWNVIVTPKYAQHTSDFKKAADALRAAAKAKKMDKAVKAYNTIVTECVACHDYVRTVKVAQRQPNQPSQRLVSSRP